MSLLSSLGPSSAEQCEGLRTVISAASPVDAQQRQQAESAQASG